MTARCRGRHDELPRLQMDAVDPKKFQLESKNFSSDRLGKSFFVDSRVPEIERRSQRTTLSKVGSSARRGVDLRSPDLVRRDNVRWRPGRLEMVNSRPSTYGRFVEEGGGVNVSVALPSGVRRRRLSS